MSCFLTPAHRMQVKRVCIKPVIIDVIPAVKMHRDSVLLHGCYLSGAHQGRVPFVHSFQLFQRLKTRLGTLEQRMRIAEGGGEKRRHDRFNLQPDIINLYESGRSLYLHTRLHSSSSRYVQSRFKKKQNLTPVFMYCLLFLFFFYLA